MKTEELEVFANKYAIECAILVTILSSEYLQTTETPFDIDERYFTYSLNKTIAKRVKEAIQRDESLSVLDFKLYEWCEHNPTRRQQFGHILEQSPLPMKVAKAYYEYIKIEKIKSEFSNAI
jgi:hypothetical protein